MWLSITSETRTKWVIISDEVTQLSTTVTVQGWCKGSKGILWNCAKEKSMKAFLKASQSIIKYALIVSLLLNKVHDKTKWSPFSDSFIKEQAEIVTFWLSLWEWLVSETMRFLRPYQCWKMCWAQPHALTLTCQYWNRLLQCVQHLHSINITLHGFYSLFLLD